MILEKIAADTKLRVEKSKKKGSVFGNLQKGNGDGCQYRIPI